MLYGICFSANSSKQSSEMKKTQKIAYIVSRFPHLPEVFILREMVELERLGWQIELFPLIMQKQDVVHKETEYWLHKAHRLPLLSIPICKENFLTFKRSPRRYISILLQMIIENITSINLLMRALVLFPKGVYIARCLQKIDVGYVHAHYATHPALVAWLVNQLTDIPYSITVHAHDIFVRTAMLETKVRSASFVASISEFNRDYIVSLVGEWSREKIFIVHCGINPANYQPQFTAWQDGDCFEIMTIGSLQPYKGFPVMIQACKLLKERGIPFHYTVIGGGEDFAKLVEKIRDNNLEDHITLLGPKSQSQIAVLLQRPHCYVQPSIVTPAGKMEGIPVALMEAMASCVPVIATHISGIPELVRDGSTGYLVPQGSVEILAESMERVYYNPDHAKQMAANGYQHVMNEFTLVNNVKTLSRYFEMRTSQRGIPCKKENVKSK